MFTEAQKTEAIAELTAGKSVEQVSAEHGLPDALVAEWDSKIPKEAKENYALTQTEVDGFGIVEAEAQFPGLTPKEKHVVDRTLNGLGFIATKIQNMTDEDLNNPAKAAAINKYADSLSKIFNAIKNKGGGGGVTIDNSTKTLTISPKDFRP